MLRRNFPVNIPTDLLRTVAMIVEKGSFTRAGDALGLSQPAISAQIKRLQVLVGGSLFERASNGSFLTERGKLILPMARKMLETNDQMLCIGGAAKDPRPLRVGAAPFFGMPVLNLLESHPDIEVNVFCDQSDEIAKGLSDGYIDVGCLYAPSSEFGAVLSDWDEDLSWVRSAAFAIAPGRPIPLVCWPGFTTDKIAIDALQANGSAYRFAFVSTDLAARLRAASLGIGIMALPVRLVTTPLIVARDHYLPPLPQAKAGICARAGFDTKRISPFIDQLRTALVHKSQPL